MQVHFKTRDTAKDTWLAEIIISHGDQQVVFNESNYFNCGSSDSRGTYNELNGYIAAYVSLPDQGKMFNLFCEIRRILDTENPTPKVLLPLIQPLVTQLYSFTNIKDVGAYMFNNRLIHIPASIPDQPPIVKDYPTATTYNRDEYIKLINLSVLLHLFSPILADYIAKITAVTGKQFKEHAALLLLDQTNLVYTEEYVKLKTYIEAHCDKKPVPLSATLAGLSEDQFPSWMLGSIIARKLCINHVRRGDDSGHLVAQVFAYILYNTKLDGKFGGGVMPKRNSGVQGEDEREKPVIENWKTKQDIYESDILVCSIGYDDPYSAAKFIEPTLPDEILTMCLRAIPVGWNLDLARHQSMLMGWVSGEKYISPKAVEYFDYSTDCVLMAITQAILWHRGFKELAVMVGTHRDEKEMPDTTHSMIDQLSLPIRTELERYYGNILLDNRQSNNDGLIYRTIGTFTESIMTGHFKVVAPEQLLAASGIVTPSKWLVIPKNIQYIIADYIRYINRNRGSK